MQLHGANGYLVDQFLRDATNLRSDEYGGSAENRTRFLREVLTALIEVWGVEAREAVFDRLVTTVSAAGGERDPNAWWFLRNLVYLLHRLPRAPEDDGREVKSPHVAAPEDVRPPHDAEALRLERRVEDPDPGEERQHEFDVDRCDIVSYAPPMPTRDEIRAESIRNRDPVAPRKNVILTEGRLFRVFHVDSGTAVSPAYRSRGKALEAWDAIENAGLVLAV